MLQRAYERFWPVFDSHLVTRGSGGAADVVVNPQAPVYIVAGCAGAAVKPAGPFKQQQPPFSAMRTHECGYSRFTANLTSLVWQQVN
jgi:hypothetical protein